MINVIVADAIIILLTILSLGTTVSPAAMLFFGGLMLVCVTAEYIVGGEGKQMLRVYHFPFAALFVLFSGNWWSILVIACFTWLKERQTFLIVNASYAAWTVISVIADLWKEELYKIMYVGCWSVKGTTLYYGANPKRILAECLVRMLIANVICDIILLMRFLVRKWTEKRENDKLRMQGYSLREMQEIQKNKELARQNFYADKNARLVERENISRNIHNSVGHSITAAIMTLDAADALFDKKPEEAHQKMNDAADRIRGSLGAIRSAVRALDEEGSDVAVKDLICYFDNILDEFLMDTERTCDRLYEFYDLETQLPREHAEFLTGALEECLTNGVKHGDASHFVVKLSGDVAHVRLDVTDNGKSDFGEENSDERIVSGFGLKKLSAYAERCGGSTSFYNDGGFHASIELPIS